MIRRMGGPSTDADHLHALARLRRVRDRIDREHARPLDVDALARGAGMSAGHLSREFRRAYGESPYSYLMTRRIERAMALLRRGDMSVTEVCFAVGCSSLGTFSLRFSELVGMSPSAYRRHRAGATAGMPPCVAHQVTRSIRDRGAPSGGDRDAAFERVRADAAEMVQESVDQPCGVRDCAVRDPDGNPIGVNRRS